MARITVTVSVAVVLLLSATSVRAQSIWVGAAFQQDVQRFSEDGVPDRLDGSAPGWNVSTGVRAWRHLALQVEWSQGASIEDTLSFDVAVGSRNVAISSTFAHRTRALTALAGFTHRATSRVQLAYLAGAAFTQVRRGFRTNAPDVLLVFPSNTAATGEFTTTGEFVAFVAGVDAIVQLRGRVHMLAGLRAQPLTVESDVSGWSVRPVVGIRWAF